MPSLDFLNYLTEKNISLEGYKPLLILGANDATLRYLANYFPELKLSARGHAIRVIGNEKEVERFDATLSALLQQTGTQKTLTEADIDFILEDNPRPKAKETEPDTILHGHQGLVIKARTPGQRLICKQIDENDMVFAIGPAGTGKTYTAVALAVRALKNRHVRKIILTRPAVEAGERLGYLPGDLKEKLDPYLQPLYDALHDMLPPDKLKYYIETGVVQIAPLAFMRGRTLENAFVILDEAQNTTQNQMKMFLTRMGVSSKFIITGDLTQIDLPPNQPSGLVQALNILKQTSGIAITELKPSEVLRNPIVSKIIKAYDQLKSI